MKCRQKLTYGPISVINSDYKFIPYRDWIHQNLNGRWSVNHRNHHKLDIDGNVYMDRIHDFYFENEADAVAFKIWATS